ncbi:MAG: erythromycin esterase family protein [Neisseriaceae bacterium]
MSHRHIIENNLIPFDITHYSYYKELIAQIGDARVVMLGEATHGTYEFYNIRKKLTQYLIEEHGFNAIAIEGDFTSCYNINMYIQGEGDANDALSALRDFQRFPRWMWRNEVTVPFLKELRNYNDQSQQKVHFFGLDLYSLHEAILAVINFLKVHDPKAANDAIERYSCFENATQNPQEYGILVKYAHKKACVEEVVKQVLELQQITYNKMDSLEELDKLFYAKQNAKLIKNAEQYYRCMFDANVNTWNIRDNHMFETLQNILTYLSYSQNIHSKVIVWAHNSHVGNARATDMASYGELNIGELVKQHYGDSSFLLGFSTYTGTVLAASNWGENPRIKLLNPALKGSYEYMFHDIMYKNFLLIIKNNLELREFLSNKLLQRAVGVIYRPDTERQSHYHMANLADQFDAMLHIDITRAITEV